MRTPTTRRRPFRRPSEALAISKREGLARFAALQPHYNLVHRREYESARAGGASKYLDDKGLRLLAVLDAIAAERGTAVAAVSLAWLLTRPAVVAPIASARTPQQLAELLPAASLVLADDEQKRLDDASA